MYTYNVHIHPKKKTTHQFDIPFFASLFFPIYLAKTKTKKEGKKMKEA